MAEELEELEHMDLPEGPIQGKNKGKWLEFFQKHWKLIAGLTAAAATVGGMEYFEKGPFGKTGYKPYGNTFATAKYHSPWGPTHLGDIDKMTPQEANAMYKNMTADKKKEIFGESNAGFGKDLHNREEVHQFKSLLGTHNEKLHRDYLGVGKVRGLADKQPHREAIHQHELSLLTPEEKAQFEAAAVGDARNTKLHDLLYAKDKPLAFAEGLATD
jgi:hypothetical protein